MRDLISLLSSTLSFLRICLLRVLIIDSGGLQQGQSQPPIPTSASEQRTRLGMRFVDFILTPFQRFQDVS